MFDPSDQTPKKYEFQKEQMKRNKKKDRDGMKYSEKQYKKVSRIKGYKSPD